MTKKDNYHRTPQDNKASGRRDGESPKPSEPQRERNIGHKNAEEHSRKQKGPDKYKP